MAVDRYGGPERRNYMRLGTDCAVDYIKLSDELKPIRDLIDNSYSKDLSAAGVKIIVNEEIAIGSFLELHIRIPASDRFLTAIGRVVRCDKEGKKKFGIAVSFIWISKQNRALLDKYVKNKRLESLRSKIKE